jgi:hypothetical protein
MDRNELHGAILDDLAARANWDERQATFFEMRHHGLRRRSKPWQGASDVHVPLGDMAIERLKPYYFQQLFATDLIAQFVPATNQQSEFTTAAAQWFDFQLKQKSNLETEVLTAIDHLLVNGKGIMKVRWDIEKSRLRFDAVDPQHIIVPPWTESIESADRVVHVMRYSPEAFDRNPVFEVSSDQVLGDYGREAGDHSKAQEKFSREGMTWTSDGHVIVWEVWCRDAEGWYVETFCPQRPEIDVRPPYRSPFDHGRCPFVELNYEVKEKGFYSSRGVMEQIAVFEVEATRLMNEKNDAMTLYNRPLFRTDRDIPNSANLRFKPGSILPHGVAPVQFPQPPFSFDQQMNVMRDMAQQRITTPDFGISSLAGQQGDRRTATEVQAISGLHQQSSDLRMRIFRHGLASLYIMSWEVLLQYNKVDLNFWYVDTVIELPKGALHKRYGIIPSGSADGVNKPLMVQKVFQRYQLLAQNPFIDLGELTKSVLEVDDATLVKRLFRDPGTKAADDAEDQANELTFLRLGFPAVVRQNDNHEVHIQTILRYMEERARTGADLEPLEAASVEQHLEQHLQALEQTDKKKGKIARDAVQMIAAQIQQYASTQQNTGSMASGQVDSTGQPVPQMEPAGQQAIPAIP